MRSQFIEQVQILMEVQQIKSAEKVFGKSNYMWLCSKRAAMIWMSTKDEFKLRQALNKVKFEIKYLLAINSKDVFYCLNDLAKNGLRKSNTYKVANNQINADDQIQVMKQLLSWLDDNPDAHTLKIPEITLQLINDRVSSKMLTESTFSRMSSFRNSLRRFSLRSNKVIPTLAVPQLDKSRRSVTFNDEPIIYRISK